MAKTLLGVFVVLVVCMVIVHEITGSDATKKRRRRCRYIKAKGACVDIVPPHLRKLRGPRYAHCRIGKCAAINGVCLMTQLSNNKTMCECITGRRLV